MLFPLCLSRRGKKREEEGSEENVIMSHGAAGAMNIFLYL